MRGRGVSLAGPVERAGRQPPEEVGHALPEQRKRFENGEAWCFESGAGKATVDPTTAAFARSSLRTPAYCNAVLHRKRITALSSLSPKSTGKFDKSSAIGGEAAFMLCGAGLQVMFMNRV